MPDLDRDNDLLWNAIVTDQHYLKGIVLAFLRRIHR
jgi:hypothetical protein